MQPKQNKTGKPKQESGDRLVQMGFKIPASLHKQFAQAVKQAKSKDVMKMTDQAKIMRGFITYYLATGTVPEAPTPTEPTTPDRSMTPITKGFTPVKIYGMAMASTITNPMNGDIPPDVEYDLPEIVWPSTGHKLAAFRVEDSSMEPRYMPGSVAVCDCEAEITPNCVVVVKFGGTVMLKRYKRIDNVIHLKSDNPKGKNYNVHAKEIAWILKVIGMFAEENGKHI